MADTTTDVLNLIRKKLPPGRTELKMEDRLEDLGIDSLSTVELIFELEEKFNIQIPYNANDTEPEFQTVAEVVDAIKMLVDKKS
ncbi:MAG TPA: phosphopantetheine-binding protein [Steroidobacteraceae bacterium]|jgi:acyl carrier protein|nr:phosphopantetheine-binding protein [Steroidobacteraceae bacterium]